MDLRSTLNLPNPDQTIPMKANLPVLEPAIQAKWDAECIYHRIQESRKDAPVFVLHDGPPYTNSPVHIGTVFNKILKDFIVKSRTMMGYRAPYVPGFDNHGLPIEQAVLKKFAEKKLTPDILEIRAACRAHSAEYVAVQTAQFKRFGVFGLWEEPYITMDFKFEAEILRVFKRLAEGGRVYRGLRPILWSPTSRTALADSEIVYHDHVSKAIYVRFPILEDPNKLFKQYPHLYTIIWTTTPWTIPANLAVAFHPTLTYVVVSVGDAQYLIAEALLEKTAQSLGWESYEVLERLDGINLNGAKFKHPIFDRPSIAVMAEYVTTEDGTGVVHTAPSHGRDDFYTGQAYGLPVPNTVDERGYLTEEAGQFAGTFYSDCDTVVVDALKEAGALLKVEDYSHSYPYAERDEKPVIFRATEQWFVAIEPLRAQMLNEIRYVPIEEAENRPTSSKGVSWVPPTAYNRIDAMVRNRPDWCISRQRPWGVGIPVFYGANTHTPVLDPVAIESVAKLVEQEGSDAWFTKDPSEILPPGYKHPQTGETEFTKETDVLDVWFDAGSTSLCVLEGNVNPHWKEHWPADLYLEGSDQHRGWFNTSLIIGAAIHGQAPYRQVVTHGFVTDEKGFKQSKRLGNVVDPEKAANQYGADVVRYWVASVDYPNDVPCSDGLLKQLGENYRNVRNTLRFLLGLLSGFKPDEEANVPLLELDEWVIEQTDLLVADCVEAYKRYDFGMVISNIHNFCKDQLSRFYLDVIKDRMYCDGVDWPRRVSGQRASYYVLVRLLNLVSPVLVHTAEETWSKLSEVLGHGEATGSIHMEVVDLPSQERLEAIEGSSLQARFAEFLALRNRVNIAFEAYKGTDDIKDSQDAILKLCEQGSDLELLRTFSIEDLSTMFKVSWLELSEGPSSIEFQKSLYLKCERSRLRRPDVESIDGMLLTARDRKVLGL